MMPRFTADHEARRKDQTHEMMITKEELSTCLEGRSPWDRALLCLLWLFGRREKEIIFLDRNDVEWTEEMLRVRFRTLKRKAQIPKSWRLILRNPQTAFAVEPIIEYVQGVQGVQGSGLLSATPLFPGHCGIRHVRIKGKTKVYEYVYDLTGRITPEYLQRLVNDALGVWPHFLRHSTAFRIKERGGDAFDMRDWFSWSDIDPANIYLDPSEKRAEKVGRSLS
jgi:integrase